MKDKTKKWLAVVILLAVCAGLLFGIHRMFYREPGREAEGVQATSQETEIYVETETTDVSETENQEAEPKESLVIEAQNRRFRKPRRRQKMQSPVYRRKCRRIQE